MFRVLVAALLLSVVLLGCGAADVPVEQPVAGDDGGGSTAMCAPGVTDCEDTVVDHVDGRDQLDAEQARADARALVGAPESELDGSVRVRRRGDEQMMLTEDYVLGRMTVELDERDGGFVVTSVTVELPDGPETFRR